MSVISKLVISLLLALGNLGLWKITCYVQLKSDHLMSGDQLNDTNPVICSAGNSYCMAFMTISGDSPFYYLVVYNEFSESMVWIANRNDQILNPSLEALTLDRSGVLKITHQGQEPTILYSPPADQPHDLINNTNATLLDTGNFVLQQHHPNGSNIVLWQSFDYPTNTLLPGMRLGVNHKTGKNRSLVSYFLHTSASPGPFTVQWETRIGQLIILRRGQVYWASGVLRNGKFENISEEAQGLYNYTIVSNKDEEYFTFAPRNDATKFEKQSAEWSIDPTGRLLERSSVIASADNCYGHNSDGGCQLWDQPACRHNGEFFDSRLVSVTDQGITYSTDDNVSLIISDCQARCWNNCHCVGFTSYNDNETGCVFYFEKSQMSVPEDQVLKLYFLANSSEPKDKGSQAHAPSLGPGDQYRDSNASTKRIKLLIAVISIITLLIICAILWLLLRRRKLMLEGKKRTKMEDAKVSLEISNEDANADELQNYKKDGHALKFFCYASVMEATNSFSSENKLGEGGFGHVYKGKLQSGKEVAIKRLSRSSRQGVIEFKNELTLISELQHRNLVQLIGCCIQGEERILIYEYMPNKSLDFFLFDSTKSKLLDWKARFNIIEGIAQGLLYLHKYSRLRVVHRDLKASNILLDENMNPKISDFGLARIITQGLEGSTQRIVGTYGYMSPEYAMEGIFSIKSDVYSFGILMLEIVSGRRNNSFYNENCSLTFVGHAWELWKEGAALKLADQGIKDSLVQDQVLRCIHIALLCAEERAVDRPTMADISSMLTNESAKLPLLKRPALCFVNDSSANDIENMDSPYGLSSLIVSLGIKVTERKREGYCDTC